MKWDSNYEFEGRLIQVIKKTDGNHSVLIPDQLNYTVVQEGDVWTLYITVDPETNKCEKIWLNEKEEKYGITRQGKETQLFDLNNIEHEKSIDKDSMSYLKVQVQYLQRIKKFVEKSNI